MSEIVRFALRLPREVYEAVQELAEEDRRSTNGEIVYILERYIAEARKDQQEPEGKEAA
ncbi:MAG: Arc family DNA-binding protein [Chloroflexota bacterium]|nr:Arc family DNA-binding protein [Chloroflexota bacterium]